MARLRGHYHESSDCFEYPKKSLPKSSHPKNYLPNFPTQKKSRNRKFQSQKKSFSHPRHLKSGVPPGAVTVCLQVLLYQALPESRITCLDEVMDGVPIILACSFCSLAQQKACGTMNCHYFPYGTNNLYTESSLVPCKCIKGR